MFQDAADVVSSQLRKLRRTFGVVEHRTFIIGQILMHMETRAGFVE